MMMMSSLDRDTAAGKTSKKVRIKWYLSAPEFVRSSPTKTLKAAKKKILFHLPGTI